MNEISAASTAARTAHRIGEGGLALKLAGRPVVIDRAAAPGAPGAAGRSSPRPSDRVELSDRAYYLAKMFEEPEIRFDLVARARGEIATGAMDTPERFDAALDGLVDDLELT